MNGLPRVVLTRPLREAERWARQLEDFGLGSAVLPLIVIAPHDDKQAMQDAWGGIGAVNAVMLVSANAVEHFFAARPAAPSLSDGGLPARLRFWATGHGTRAELLTQGVLAAQIDSPPEDAVQFDSESLWQQVAGQVRPGQRVLIVRGADADGAAAGRDWLARQLAAAGATVSIVLAYRRVAPQWSDAERANAAQAAADGSVWLFSSSEAVAHLRRLLPTQSWQQARAVATHGRIAQAAEQAGFGAVHVSRPTLEDVVASIKSAHVQPG